MSSPNQKQNNKDQQGARPAFLGFAVVLLVGLGIAAWFSVRKKSEPSVSEADQPQVSTSTTHEQAAPQVPREEELVPVEITNANIAVTEPGRKAVQKQSAPAKSQRAEVPAIPRYPVSEYTRQLVSKLANLDQAGGLANPDQAAAWKQNLLELTKQGVLGVGAIQEFLDKNSDYLFGSQGQSSVGYSSARVAMFDALRQIGGPEAMGVLTGVLQSTADPGEIAALAQNLEQMAPDQFRSQILDAARQVLASAGNDPKANPADVAPLFEVLDKYGGAGAVAELQDAASKWKYYSIIALGQLQDGAGVPALIQMIQDPAGGAVKNIPALEMLAQAAAQNTDARTALIQQLKANNISPNTWPYLLPLLSGDRLQFLNTGQAPPADMNDVRTFHIAAGNQNFFTAPPIGGLTPEQMQQQLGLIDELLAATTDPNAVRTLQSARNTLVQRQQAATPARTQGNSASVPFSIPQISFRNSEVNQSVFKRLT